MSKTRLKKVLADMTAAQITEILLELYDARKEAKEYLNFFVDPDIDKKLDSARNAIKKELTRTSRGRNRTRSSHLRRIIKSISSLNPGSEPICEIMTYTVETACLSAGNQWIKESTQLALAKLTAETVKTIDASGLLHVYLPRIQKAVNGIRTSPNRSDSFKTLVSDTLHDTLESLQHIHKKS